jgi:hypothetical protein
MKYMGYRRKGYVRLIISENGKRYSARFPASANYTDEFVEHLWQYERYKFKPYY